MLPNIGKILLILRISIVDTQCIACLQLSTLQTLHCISVRVHVQNYNTPPPHCCRWRSLRQMKYFVKKAESTRIDWFLQ